MDSGRIVDFGALIGSNPSLSSGESSANLTSSHAAEAAARDTLRSFAQIGSGQTNARSGNRKSGAVARRDAKRCSSSAWAERSWALVNDTNGKDERRHSLSAERPNSDRGSSDCLQRRNPRQRKETVLGRSVQSLGIGVGRGANKLGDGFPYGREPSHSIGYCPVAAPSTALPREASSAIRARKSRVNPENHHQAMDVLLQPAIARTRV
jgi:hypothetical protein